MFTRTQRRSAIAMLFFCFCSGEPAGVPEPESRHVFLIVVDTTRTDVLSSFNPLLPKGGGFRELARDGVLLENLYAPSSWTRTSVASLMTGTGPSRHGVADRFSSLPKSLPTLAAQLRASGYATFGWSANPNILPEWGFDAGFGQFVDTGRLFATSTPPEATMVFGAARVGVQARGDEPGFYYIHVMDPHAPYVPPPEIARGLRRWVPSLSRAFPGVPAVQVDLPLERNPFFSYLGEVRDADLRLKEFLAFLRSQGIYRDALIAVVSDHGEEFQEHGRTGHGRSLYEEVLRVPGVIKLPGNERAGERVAGPVELADLSPTILAALGLPVSPANEGRDFLSGNEEPRIRVASLDLDGHHQRAIYDENWKLILDQGAGEVELFDLESDPAEKINLEADHPEKVLHLRSMLERRLSHEKAGWHLRGCGCPSADSISFALTKAPGDLHEVGLESDDLMEPLGDGRVQVRFELNPIHNSARRFGRVQDVWVGDVDELYWPGSQSIRLELQGDRRRVGIGEGDAVKVPHVIDLDSDDIRSHRLASDRPPCESGRRIQRVETKRSCQPVLHVWYVSRDASTSVVDPDPELLERLRALGYGS